MENVSRPKTLLAFGDPIYDLKAPLMAERSSSQSSSYPGQDFYADRGFNFTSLPYTRAEVDAISALYPKGQRQVYLGAQAREEVVKAERLDQYRYLHFATHGLINEQIPSRSGIVLSLIGDSKEDGILQMREIMHLKLNADLVTLSACSTALGKLVDGEGMIGLTRAFIYAGADSVVVSLWNVNDSATAELMRDFYQNLKRGLPKDDALRQAKLKLLNSSQPAWRHPYFWAPFVLEGERESRSNTR
jgi:CHAT domain-containing protein